MYLGLVMFVEIFHGVIVVTCHPLYRVSNGPCDMLLMGLISSDKAGKVFAGVHSGLFWQCKGLTL